MFMIRHNEQNYKKQIKNGPEIFKQNNFIKQVNRQKNVTKFWRFVDLCNSREILSLNFLMYIDWRRKPLKIFFLGNGSEIVIFPLIYLFFFRTENLFFGRLIYFFPHVLLSSLENEQISGKESTLKINSNHL